MDRITAMNAFVRVVEAGTFTKAADTLDVPNAIVFVPNFIVTFGVIRRSEPLDAFAMRNFIGFGQLSQVAERSEHIFDAIVKIIVPLRIKRPAIARDVPFIRQMFADN